MFVNELSDYAKKLKEDYQSARPFPYCIIDDCFDHAELLADEFPKISEGEWWNYNNSLEMKFARDDVYNFPDSIQEFIYHMNSQLFVKALEHITGIENLITDHTLNGGGLHQILPGGKLDIHADYNYHPKTKLDRRLNVILFLNPDWKEEWGGHLELWDKDMTQCVQKIAPIFNRLVIFNVNDWSYHGHPEPLACPDGVTRKSIAMYYYTNGRPHNEITTPHSVIFKKRPQDLEDPEIEALRQQRLKGRIG